MAVTANRRGFVATAVNDAVTGLHHVISIQLAGTGMTVGQRLTIKDTSGAIVVDHYVESAEENKEFVVSPRWINGIKLTAVPAAGTWTIAVQYG